MQMSQPGGTTINDKGIAAWHDYMVNHFRLGQPTGIEQGYEASGYVPPADFDSPSIDLHMQIRHLDKVFSVTAIQEIAAFQFSRQWRHLLPTNTS